MSEIEPLNTIVNAPIQVGVQVAGRVVEEVALLPVRAATVAAEVATRGAMHLTGSAMKGLAKMGIQHAQREMMAAMSKSRGRGIER